MFRQFVENIKTDILCSATSDNRAVYEVKLKIIVDPGRPPMTYGSCALRVG